MNRGILFATLAALAWSPLGVACRNPAGPEQIKAVENLMTRVEAAHLTLNELDRGRYGRAAALFRSEAERFSTRFQDTLDRRTAEQLGNQYLVLRAADGMGRDHDAVLLLLLRTRDRLHDLRNDLVSGAIGEEEAQRHVAAETRAVDALDAPVQAVIANYKAVQRAWDDLAEIDPLMAASPNNPMRP